ncbi:hypothetical protein M514_02948 [Trichuris suis]|uniref:Uncharacterized protein n=1 Tax=Trichuris suis TaxID=68888 RepID=A0A085NI80_9BILA|nr:hypothetical protein M514_02948 [Trichuris suis]
MGWLPVEEDQNLSRNLPELAAAVVTMPQEAPVHCPLCSLQGRWTRLILCKISLEIAILCCPEVDCIYPFNLEREQFQLHFLETELTSLFRGEVSEDTGNVDDPEGFHEVEISRGLSEEIRSLTSVDIFRKRLGENMKELKRRLDSYEVFYPVKDLAPSSGELGAVPPMTFCTECAERGVQSKLILARVSFRRGLLICPVGECSFPLDQGPDVLSRLCVRTESPAINSFELRKVGEALRRLCSFIDEAVQSESSSNSNVNESETSENLPIHSGTSPMELENSTGAVSEGRMPSVLMDDENCIPLPLETNNPVIIPMDGESIVQYEGKNDATLTMEDEEVKDISERDESDQSVQVECEPSVDESVQIESSLSTQAEFEQCDGDSEKPQIKTGQSPAIAIESEDLVVSVTQNECHVDIPIRVNVLTSLQPESVDHATTPFVLENEAATATEEKDSARFAIENEHQTSKSVAGDVTSIESSPHVLPREEIPATASVKCESTVDEESTTEAGIGVSNVAPSVKADQPSVSAVDAASPMKSQPYELLMDKSETSEAKSMEPENHNRVPAKIERISTRASKSKADANSTHGRPQRSRRAPLRFDDYLCDDSELLSATEIESARNHVVESSSEMVGRGKRRVGSNCRSTCVKRSKRTWRTRRAKRTSEEDNVIVTEELLQCSSFNEVENTISNGKLNGESSNGRSVKYDDGYFRRRAWKVPTNGLSSPSLGQSSNEDSAPENEEYIPGRPPGKIRLVSKETSERRRRTSAQEVVSSSSANGQQHDLVNCRDATQNGTTPESMTNGAEALPKKSFFARIKKQLMNACAEAAAAEQKLQAGVPTKEINRLDDEIFGEAQMLPFDSFEAGTSEASTSFKSVNDASLEQQFRETSIQMKDGQSSSTDSKAAELLNFEELDFSAFDDICGFSEAAVAAEDELII